MKNKAIISKHTIAPTPPVTRREAAFVALVLLIGIVLRCSMLSRASVEHFDEGVYASNFWFAGGGAVYPFQYLYAPPLLPTLVAWSINLLGSGHLGTMSVNLLFGSATIVLAWWVARSMFGSAAGAATATLAATSDFHILYSRTVLTDPLLCFWAMAAVYLAWEAQRRRSVGWAIVAGIATAAAWWTKYNGWLPLAISLSGLVAWLLFHRPANTSPLKTPGLWLIMAVAAFVLWSPVLYGLADKGGYAAVQANHRGYVVGLDGWMESLRRHVGSQRHFESWLAVIGTGIALLAAATYGPARKDSTWNSLSRTIVSWLPAAMCVIALSALIGSSVVLSLSAIIGLSASLWMVGQKRSNEGENSDRALAYWMALAWLIGLVAVTPFYRAYPRLALPSLVASWLGAGAAVGMLFEVLSRRESNAEAVAGFKPSGRQLLHCTIAAAVLIGVLVFSQRLHSRGIPGWEDRTGLESIAAQIAKDGSNAAAQGGPVKPLNVYYVFGEPALVYHLSALGETAVPIGDLAVLRSNQLPPGAVPYLVAGSHVVRTPAFVDEMSKLADHFKATASYEYWPSDLVLMDEHPAEVVESSSFYRTQEIRLYRVR